MDPSRPDLTDPEKEEAEISVKYEGYIKREQAQIAQFRKLENKRLPQNTDYSKIRGLRLEAAQKLNKQQPSSIGQASRISGVNPADVSVLLIHFGMV